MAEKGQEREKGKHVLQVPLDASQIEGFKPERPVKVVVRARDGTTQSEEVQLDAKGGGSASFEFAERPDALRVMVGPPDASNEEMHWIQTLGLDVSARAWLDRRELTLTPVSIPPYYWYWWPRWCRTFAIRGRLLCPDGSAVPGAPLCAYDVDWRSWRSPTQQAG